MTSKATLIDGEWIAGHGQHSHAVPMRDGRVVEMRDGNHEGGGVYWSESRGEFVFVSYDRGGLADFATRVLLVQGANVKELWGQDLVYAMDLESPDGLILFGISNSEDLEYLIPAEDCDFQILWDSDSEVSET